MISHSYPLSGNSEASQWIFQLTNGQINYASIGLNGFFVISGFFIYRSFARSTSAWEFMKKRVLREKLSLAPTTLVSNCLDLVAIIA